MEQTQGRMPPEDIVEQLAMREQQLEQLRQAYIELQQRHATNDNDLQRIMKNITHLPTFTGTGEVTVNSFMSSVEYVLSTIQDEGTRREATKAIFYRVIQGEAKDVVINIPQPDNWSQIKKALKLRYKPDVEPHEIYRKICNLRANTVSELATEAQKIKYKADEINVYYKGDAGIDLSNIDSVLVNSLKEITQGTLLDKIYEEHDLYTILEIMTKRRYEDSCVRTEFKKFRRTDEHFKQNKAHYQYKQREKYSHEGHKDNHSGQKRWNNQNFTNHWGNWENNSGQRRWNNQNCTPNLGSRGNYSGQVRRNNQHFYKDNNSGQGRRNQQFYRGNNLEQLRENRNEPMEVDNIEVNHFQRIPQMGNPRPNASQNRLTQPGQYLREDYIKGRENKVADFLSRIEKNEDNILNHEDGDGSNSINLISPDGEEDNVSMVTVHSAEENLGDHFAIKEEIVNKYRTQIILTNNKTEEFREIHGKRIIFIAECDFEQMGEIFRRYILKGKIGIFSELTDHNYNIVQEKLISMYSNDNKLQFTKCTKRAQDIETEVETIKQISFYHVRESLHSGILETYNQIKNKIYYPKLMELVHLVINQCEICQEIKYDRKPIKPKFNFSETPVKKNEIIHIDTYVMKGNHFLTIIDKFSKFGAAYLLNDRNHITIVEQLEEHFAKLGKPRKIIADNEFKAVRIREFLDTENVELHLTKPNSHTGNADIERFHNTIAEKFRILYKLEKGLSIKHLIQKAIRNYNDRFHSTIKCTPNEVHDNKIDPQIIKSNLEAKKHKIISNLNKTREDYKEERTEGFIKNYKAVRHKEQPKYRKEKLENIHPNNIKRPLKFADTNYDISADMDRT